MGHRTAKVERELIMETLTGAAPMPSAQPLVAQSFEIIEATIDDIHAAYWAGILNQRCALALILNQSCALRCAKSFCNTICQSRPNTAANDILFDDLVGAREQVGGSDADGVGCPTASVRVISQARSEGQM